MYFENLIMSVKFTLVSKIFNIFLIFSISFRMEASRITELETISDFNEIQEDNAKSNNSKDELTRLLTDYK